MLIRVTKEHIHQGKPGKEAGLTTVICGTFRRDPEGLKASLELLRDLNCKVLSPPNADVAREESGFVYMRGEEQRTPESLEFAHLDAIQRAHFVWLHDPNGYVGLSAALEVGFARAVGVPVFCATQPEDIVLKSLVTPVDSPRDVGPRLLRTVPAPGVRAFQHYYRRVATQRGYETEGARDCLLLMVEEIGELARSVRKSTGLIRHGREVDADEAKELADVFIYVVHMANILNVDLSTIVQRKELANLDRFLRNP